METLKSKTAKGLLWGAVNNGSSQVLNVIFGIMLGRLLSPKEYGIIGILTIFISIAGVLQTSGLIVGLINLKKPNNNDYNSVFWFNLFISITLYILLFFSAPLIASYFKQECLIEVSRILFLSLPISALSATCAAYLIKNMMNKEIAIIAICSLIIAGCVGISLALLNYSYWSLVWQQLTYVSVICIGRFFFVPWRPSLTIDFSPVRKMFPFCIRILITSLLTTINQNLLTVIFGRLFSIGAVGNYTQANKWNNMANNTVASTVGQIAQTVLVTVSDEQEREKRVMRKMMRFTAFISFPCMFGLALVAREFIVLALKEQWLESARLLQILCIGGAFVPFYTMYQNLVISSKRSDIYLRLNIVQIALQTVVILLFYRMGMTTMIVVYTAFTIVWLLAWQRTAYNLLHITLWETLRDICPFMLAAAFVMAVTWFCTKRITNNWLLLITRIVMAASIYFVVMKLCRTVILDECIAFLRKRKAT